MKIINLVEDTKGKRSYCLNEHGLCFYIETGKHRILMDTGASDAFIINARKLGVDITSIDTVVLSHGHYDHGGGLSAFMGLNKRAKIYVNAAAGGDFYSMSAVEGQNPVSKYIGLDKEAFNNKRCIKLGGNLKKDHEIFIFSGITGRKYWPGTNLLLKKKVNGEFVQDEFEDEQCLVLTEKINGKVIHILFSGCAHNGIINIMERYKELFNAYPEYVVSGFHMSRKGNLTQEDEADIRNTAAELLTMGTVFYTGHCTGKRAYLMMKEIMGDKLRIVHCGDVLMDD